MARGQQIIEKIKTVFAEIRAKYQHITDEDLRSNGAIFYMNKCDGTCFEWTGRNHTGAFCIYHKNGFEFIRLYAYEEDAYTAFVFPDAERISLQNFRNTETIRGDLDKGDSFYLATILYNKADREHIRDANIDEIDFAYEPKECELLELDEEGQKRRR